MKQQDHATKEKIVYHCLSHSSLPMIAEDIKKITGIENTGQVLSRLFRQGEVSKVPKPCNSRSNDPYDRARAIYYIEAIHGRIEDGISFQLFSKKTNIDASNDLEPLLTAEDVAIVLNCSTRAVWTLAVAGTIPAVRISKRMTRFRPQDLRKLIRDNLS